MVAELITSQIEKKNYRGECINGTTVEGLLMLEVKQDLTMVHRIRSTLKRKNKITLEVGEVFKVFEWKIFAGTFYDVN